jgi:DNA-binding NarL/FixJ family response regulator
VSTGVGEELPVQDPIRVLIVEDQAIFATALKLWLDTRGGIEVVGIAFDGPEAVDMALLNHADVVLMDVGLPTVDGIETTRRLLAIKPDTRVIVLTGQSEADGKDAALEAGAVEFLTKGAVHEHVRDAVYRAMQRADAADEPLH